MSRPLLPTVFLLAVGGCTDVTGVQMTLIAQDNLAVEGKTTVSVHNSCHGKFGGGPCDESQVREVKELVVADPTIASIEPSSEDATEFELTGLRPGRPRCALGRSSKTARNTRRRPI